MEDTTNLYDDLGVKKTASKGDIRDAYKKKVMESHPDRGGNTKENSQEFRKILRAYNILSDEEKRQRYDNGENPDFINQPNNQQEPLNLILIILNNIVEDSNIDIIHNDLFETIRQSIRQNQNNFNVQKNNHQNNIKRLENVIKRIKRNGKPEPDLFISLLEDKIKECNAAIIQIDRNIKLGQDALALIEDCKYETDPRQGRTVVLNFGGTGTTTSATGW